MPATDTSAAMRPYSMAVAPDSSAMRLRKVFNMAYTSCSEAYPAA